MWHNFYHNIIHSYDIIREIACVLYSVPSPPPLRPGRFASFVNFVSTCESLRRQIISCGWFVKVYVCKFLHGGRKMNVFRKSFNEHTKIDYFGYSWNLFSKDKNSNQFTFTVFRICEASWVVRLPDPEVFQFIVHMFPFNSYSYSWQHCFLASCSDFYRSAGAVVNLFFFVYFLCYVF